MNWVRTARFSPDSKLIVSGGDDKCVKLWDLATKNCIKTYWDHTGMITSTAFHPGGTIIATASSDKSINLIDIRMHKLIQHYSDAHVGAGPSFDTKGGESAWAGGGVNSVAFGGPGGNWLISTGMDGLVKIWDLKEGHLFYTLHGHKNGPTTSAVFSPEGAFFATAGSDAQVMVWKSNFDAGVPLNADDAGGKYKINPTSTSLATHPTSTDATSHPTFFSVHTKPASNPLLDPVPISRHPPGLTKQRKMASMNTNLVTTLPGKQSPGRKSPVTGIKGYSADARSGTGEELAGARLEAEQPEIVSVGEPLLNQQEPAHTAGSPQYDSRNRPSSPQYEHDRYQDSSPHTTPIQMRTIPDELASSLQHIITQIDVLTQTMSILETRLTSNEDRVTQLANLVSEAAGAPPRRTTQQRYPTNGGTSSSSSSAFGARANPQSQNASFVRQPSPDIGSVLSGGGGGGNGMGKLQEPLIPRSVHVQTQRPGVGTGATRPPVNSGRVGSPINLMY
ncbi:POC1 centriolar protein A [Podochytrium sp. JEL0797]|nr:POC1 centriolar protein A [Podochytrium sp. JEL0797]